LTVSVSVYNHGNVASSGSFIVEWWASTGAASPACTWTLGSIPAHGGYVKTCQYTYPSWYGHITTQIVVDPGHAVAESDEGNNVVNRTVPVLNP
jgi:hypothetical protein